MSKINNEKFGIALNSSETPILKKMGVPESNIDFMTQSRGILNRMSVNDTLCVSSVQSFSNGAYDLFNKIQYLMNRGVEFQSGKEKTLSFTSIKPLSTNTVEILKNFAIREQEFANWVQTSRLETNAKAQLINKIQYEKIIDICVMFSSNGLKKK